MNHKLLVLGFLSLTLTLSLHSHAANLSDVNNDTEDIANESDAAVAETKDFKDRTANDKAQAQRRHEVANRTLKAAAGKRQKAIDEMHASEAEIQRLNAEQVKYKADAVRLDNETLQADKTTNDNRAKIEKMKGELVALKQLRAEKANKFIELAGERDKSQLEMKGMDEEKTKADADFTAIKLQEKQGSEALAKTKQENLLKKAKLDAYIAGLKERYRLAQAHMTAQQNEKMEIERNQLKLEAQAKAGEAEVAQAESGKPAAEDVAQAAAPAPASEPAAVAPSPAPVSIARAPVSVASSTDLTFKRKCRVFDGPVRGSNVLAVQESGVSVAKNAEGKEWVSFLLNDGRKAFAAKGCFR